MTYIQLLSGLLLLAFGGDLLIRGAVVVAEKLGVSKLFIGLVLVGFGTSVPELATSLRAALAGSPAIAVGNVIGSNIANILLILGVTACLASIKCVSSSLFRDGLVMLLATMLFISLANFGEINRLHGALMLLFLAAYVGGTYVIERRQNYEEANLHAREADLAGKMIRSLPLASIITFIGGALILIGASLMVTGAISAARQLGISETVIGLTVVAVGTSLPELSASIMAARRGETELAFGNIVGSNIFNLLGILGVTAVVTKIEIQETLGGDDLIILLGTTLLLLLFAWTGRRIAQWEGLVFLIFYMSYLTWLAIR